MLTPNLGDRVLAVWPAETGWWYPATVIGVDGDRALVQYDDGDRAPVTTDELRLLRLGTGARVFGRWQAGQSYYPGQVTQTTGNAIHIAYDDGDEEWTTVGLVRVQQNDVPLG
jgi:DNA repair protein Crb2 Tudor domain